MESTLIKTIQSEMIDVRLEGKSPMMKPYSRAKNSKIS